MKNLLKSSMLAFACITTLLACSSGNNENKRTRRERQVSYKDFPRTWPFVHPSGTLICEENAVFFYAGGKYYAITGNARGTGKYLGYEVLKFDEGWNHMGDRSEILDAGKALCK